MTRRLVVEWRPGRRVEALLRLPADGGSTGILLAPGAGAGQRHPFLAGLRDRFAAAGYPTMTFDYPYVAAGRRAPDRPAILLECHAAAARRLRSYVDGVVLAGKSMGGRMASHLAAGGEPGDGLVCYGYPLIPPGSTEPRPVDHLTAVEVPILFVSGSRDRMAPLPLLEELVGALPGAMLRVVEGADHGFGFRKADDPGADVVLDHLVELTLAWMGR